MSVRFQHERDIEPDASSRYTNLVVGRKEESYTYNGAYTGRMLPKNEREREIKREYVRNQAPTCLSVK